MAQILSSCQDQSTSVLAHVKDGFLSLARAQILTASTGAWSLLHMSERRLAYYLGCLVSDTNTIYYLLFMFPDAGKHKDERQSL